MITREKAIEVLEKAKGLDDQFYAYTQIHYLESIDMAIEVLKAQETPIERVASDYGLKVDGVRFALEQYQTVICEITRSRMSKLSYYAKDIIQLANEMMCEGCELQEAQEPSVITWRDVIGAAIECKPLFIEVKDYEYKEPGDDRWAMVTQYKDSITNGMIRAMSSYVTSEILFADDYSKTWRCWTSRPTDAQREVIPWSD